MSKFWSIFVGCSSNDNLVFRAFEVLLWSDSSSGIVGALAQSLLVMPEGEEVVSLGHLML